MCLAANSHLKCKAGFCEDFEVGTPPSGNVFRVDICVGMLRSNQDVAPFTDRRMKSRRRIFALLALVMIAAIVGSFAFAFRRPLRVNTRRELFRGITYRREARNNPWTLMLHIVTVDLTALGLEFLVTPGDQAVDREVSASTTSEFLK